MAVAKELLQMDLYALLGIEEEATDKEMKKAYRQKALSCHPDKNPDNPKAAELFHQLSQALEVLTDAAARAAYDKVRKAKKQAAERTQKLDERRKKVKLDLEARERQAQAHGSDEEEKEESRSTGTLEQEIRRLREEGSRQLEEQQRVIQEQIRQEREQRLRGMAENPESKGTPKLKVSPADLQATSHHLLSAEQMIPWAQLKWKSKKEAKSQGGYSRDVLLRLFQKYGEVLNLVLSSKKAGTAVVEFATIKAAELAVQNEVGLVDNPLKISWLEGRPQSTMGPNHPGLSQVSHFPLQPGLDHFCPDLSCNLVLLTVASEGAGAGHPSVMPSLRVLHSRTHPLCRPPSLLASAWSLWLQALPPFPSLASCLQGSCQQVPPSHFQLASVPLSSTLG
ncbi:dnaJ homolog subfamily C member 17 isoform X1 [Eubalaena glacialis]|uniref:dnaJ homolog subfamily C member 17 isoform X1 n=1 Tax=Eubalaena glacialis TaxID=27606 RepID=UPI002A5AE376|nr:dnaJ homolog subfamily C member 17 isoform X1 [Eubalaena glacialis]